MKTGRKIKKRDLIYINILIAVITYGAISFANKTYTFSGTKFLMDTIVDIKIVTKNEDAEFLIDEAFEIINEYEKVLSFYNKDSVLWKFNNNVSNSMPLDEDLLLIYFLCEQLYRNSGSLYDISIGALSELWDFNKLHIPSKDSIKIALDNVGFEKLTLDGVHLSKPEGVKINLGSLAKGFIIDEVMEYLVSQGIESSFVNAGGDMLIFGQKKPLRIGIQHPRNNRNELIGVLKINNKAVVTSGDYERFFELDGKRYHHILDPKTGYPAEGTISVTVIAPTALIADAYSTALFLMKPQMAIELIDRTDKLEAVIFYLEDSEIKKLESIGMENYMN